MTDSFKGSLHLPPKRTIWQRIHRYRLLWIVALATLFLDQASKTAVSRNIPFPTFPGSPEAVPVLKNFFYIIHVGNTGAAWSLFTGKSVFLAILAIAMLSLIYLFRQSLALYKRSSQFTFGLLCGGIVGNLLDRLLHGHVIDFLDFHIGSYIYPTFNVADCAICIGAVLYFIQNIRSEKK